MTTQESRALSILARVLRTDPTKIRPEDRLREDLGADSLNLIELLYDFEEAFAIRIPDEVAVDLRTVKDVLAALEKGIGQEIGKSSSP